MEDCCLHVNWKVDGSCPMGKGWCHDCKKHIGLAELFENLRKRMIGVMVSIFNSPDELVRGEAIEEMEGIK